MAERLISVGLDVGTTSSQMVLSELLVVRGRCLRGDWPGVADTIGAVCLAGMVLLAVSAAVTVRSA